MSTSTAIETLRRTFDQMVVYKDLKKNNFFSSLGLPSFLRDWLLKKFADDEGNLNVNELADFIRRYLPSKEEWVRIKDRVINDNERVKLLTKISVDISVKTSEISFALPEFGLSNKETVVDAATWAQARDALVSGQEVWGVVELGYRPPDDSVSPKLPGKIRLAGFRSFCPYEINLEYYKDARDEFQNVEEWIDVLLGAVDYDAAGYEKPEQKLAMLTRLLPFVEKRLNLLELAPKGAGKSYIFGHVSKYGLLTDGGKITRAKMFYDLARNAPGFVMGNDFVAIDEVKLVQFGDVNEMRSILQGYMEYGQFNIGGYEGKSDAGVVFLGNIAQDNMDVFSNMFSELPALFQESALVDRIHGFIEGWSIPRMNENLKLSGWALNSEYFCTILHELRDDLSYRAIVDEILMPEEKADARDTEAIKRIATAYLKLLFPNVRSAKELDLGAFKKYCLTPARSMRKIIKRQLGILDKEFRGKNVPHFALKDCGNEN